MEKFAEHIIETDRQARKIIEDAQMQSKKMLEQTDEEIEKMRATHEEKLQTMLQAIDNSIADAKLAQEQKAHEDYITVKHELDMRFDKHHDTWENEIVQDIIASL